MLMNDDDATMDAFVQKTNPKLTFLQKTTETYRE